MKIMANHNLQQLPRLTSPKVRAQERAEQDIEEYRQVLSDGLASKLYRKSSNVNPMIVYLRELAQMLADYSESYNKPSPPPQQSVTRKLTVEETRQPVGSGFDMRKLETAMYGT